MRKTLGRVRGIRVMERLIGSRRSRWSAILPLGVVILVMLIAAGCTRAQSALPAKETVDSSNASALSASEQAAVYAQVVEWAHGGSMASSRWRTGETVYLARSSAGSSMPASQSLTLGTEVQSLLASALAGTSSKLVWVDTAADAPRDASSGAPRDDGVIVVVGRIDAAGTDAVRVPVSAFFGTLGASDSTYVLKRANGAWRVDGVDGR